MRRADYELQQEQLADRVDAQIEAEFAAEGNFARGELGSP